MKSKVIISAVAISTFLLARNLKYFYGFVVYGKEAWNNLDKTFAGNLLVYSQIILALIATFILFRSRIWEVLGMNKRLLEGIIVGLLCSLPMLIGYGILNGFSINLDLELIHKDFVVAGFFEEFLFRGFLFGILYYYGGWGFIPAVILPSIFFGIGHLYQAENVNEAVSVFLFTGLGSAGFSWFYTAWRNLWVVVFLHAFMDLAWEMFQVETNVTGNLMVNVFRVLTLGLMVFLSIRHLKKHPENSIQGKLWTN